MDHRAFGLAVDELKAKGNSLVQQVWVCDGPAGRSCQDFNEVMSIALHAGFVSYLSPEYSHFLSNLSPRGADVILNRTQASDVERREAEELIETYLSKAR